MEGSYNITDVLYRNITAGRENQIAIFGNDAKLTYGEVIGLANRAGHALKSLGVERENRVVLLLLDGPEFVASFFGAAAIGAVPVPLNPVSLAADYQYFLNHTRAKVAVVSAALYYLIEPVRAQCPHLQHVVVTGGQAFAGTLEWQSWINQASSQLDPIETSADETAFWLYSSGSTGRPKGVLHVHRSVPFTCQHYAREVLGLSAEDICFSGAKLFHAYGLGNSMTFPFYAGASTVLWPGPPLPETLFEIITRFKPTVFFATPALYAAMLSVPDAGEKYDLSSLRLCVSAAEALPAAILERWEEQFGVPILDGIGSTEMLHIFISNRPGSVRAGSSGQLVPGYRAKILSESGTPVPQGEVGDLWISGESSATGYWNNRSQTQFTMRGEWIFTGDKYRVDAEGCFWYQGRSDDMLKINGLWVSPLDLETILNQHPNVVECAVVGVRDEEGLMQAKAFVVLQSGVEGLPALVRKLQGFVKQRAPQKYPRMFEFVPALPKTGTGKIKRFELRNTAAPLRS